MLQVCNMLTIAYRVDQCWGFRSLASIRQMRVLDRHGKYDKTWQACPCPLISFLEFWSFWWHRSRVAHRISPCIIMHTELMRWTWNVLLELMVDAHILEHQEGICPCRQLDWNLKLGDIYHINILDHVRLISNVIDTNCNVLHILFREYKYMHDYACMLQWCYILYTLYHVL